MHGDPNPVCLCGDYTPDSGHYVEALKHWICTSCLSRSVVPSNRELREAIASIRTAI